MLDTIYVHYTAHIYIDVPQVIGIVAVEQLLHLRQSQQPYMSAYRGIEPLTLLLYQCQLLLICLTKYYR